MTAASVAGGRGDEMLSFPTPEANSEGHHLSDSLTDYTISFVAEAKHLRDAVGPRLSSASPRR
jgi:hypothetical protein